MGVDILGQGQTAKKTMRGRAMPLLLALAAREQDPAVIESLCHAFGHLHDPASIDILRGWATHPHEDVRYGVVHGLTGYDDDRAIDTLIRLSADDDSDVRDWATFALGTQIDTDTAAVRDALRARLNDPDDDTCLEALAGLARRHDPGVTDALRVLLAGPNGDAVALESALALSDPAFHGALERLSNARHSGQDDVLSNVMSTLAKALENRGLA